MALPLFEKIIKKLTELEKNKFGYIPIGGCCEYYGTIEPDGFMFPDGRAISREEYSEVFKVFGTTYGAGDGQTTFNIPDKRGYTSVMLKSGSTNFGTLGKKVGEETHKLTVNEIPTHNHGVTDPGHTHKWYSSSATGTIANSTRYQGDSKSISFNTDSAKTGITINNTGGNGTHNNIQPSLVCNFLIRVK